MLGGLLFHHKDDKAGQQDTFSWFFSQQLGHEVTYPGTSSTRYQSNCDGAEFILLHRGLLIQFMDHICHKKDKVGLTNLKKNFLAAIQDPPTIAELLMLLIYSLVFSHLYMWYICGLGVDDVNLLELGLLYQKMAEHYQKIIADPDLVIGLSATSATGTFDGKPWHNKNTFKAMQEWILKLPYLRNIFIAFMQGCLTTWIRFTSEFKAGGVIDGLTAKERDAAWMPATNDVNEGALGTLRITMWRKPHLTLHQFNAYFMFNQNKTQDWMDKELTDEDHAYICWMAWDLDKSRPELKWKAEQVSANNIVADAKWAKIQEQQKKKQEMVKKLWNVVLILEEDKIQRLGVKAIKEQLDIYCHYDSAVPIKAWLNGTEPDGQREWVNALLEAIEWIRALSLTDPRPQSSENTSNSFEGTSNAVRGDYIYILKDEDEEE